MTVDERISLRDRLMNELKVQNIVSYNKDYSFIRKSRLDRVKKIDLYNLYVSQFENEKEAIYCLLHDTDPSEHVCVVCGEHASFSSSHNKYMKTCCSMKCRSSALNSQKSREKAEETCIKKFGFKNAFQDPKVRERAEETNLERYGYRNAMQNEDIKHKRAQNNIRSFGVPNPMQSKEVKEKRKQKNLMTRGVAYEFQDPRVREKAEQTNLSRYGHKNAMQNKSVREKRDSTCLKKYGVRNPFQDKDVKEKIIQTNITRYGCGCSSKCPDVREKMRRSKMLAYKLNLLTNDEFDRIVYDDFDRDVDIVDIYSNDENFRRMIRAVYKYKNRLLRLTEVAEVFGITPQTVKKRIEQLNLSQYFFIQGSSLELQFEQLLVSKNVDFKRRDRSTILYNDSTRRYLEIDFLLKRYKLGFEINDVASHNVTQKGCRYHLNKTTDALKNNIRLVHIWEWELTNPVLWQRLSNWVLDLINQQKNRIYARKCEVRVVPLNEERWFLNQYHMQGYRRSSVCYGLYYNDELVQLMSFCRPRYNRNYEWELLRLCTKYGCTVTGGANRLLKFFVKQHAPKSIISYCDLSKFTGKVYEDLGFKLVKRNQPSAIWYNQENCRTFSQSSLARIGADKLIGVDGGSGADNEKIAIDCGYKKIYNCGINSYMMAL